jgi:hypothetical protein
MGAAVPTILLLAFFVFRVWPGHEPGAGVMQSPKQIPVLPKKVVRPNVAPPVKAPGPPPVPNPPAPVNKPVAAAPGGVQANPAPPLAKPANPPVGNAKAKAQQAADVRGPVPQIGFKFRESWKSECQRTDRFTDAEGRVVSVRGSILGDFENLHTVQDVLNDEGMRFTNRILMAMVRSPRADPSVSRRPQHGQARRQTA